MAPDDEIFLDGQVGEDVAGLRNEADAETNHLMRRKAGDITPVMVDAAALEQDEAGDRLEKGRLAGAIRADDGHDLAWRDLDGNVLHDRQPGHIAGNDVARDEDRSRHIVTSPR